LVCVDVYEVPLATLTLTRSTQSYLPSKRFGPSSTAPTNLLASAQPENTLALVPTPAASASGPPPRYSGGRARPRGAGARREQQPARAAVVRSRPVEIPLAFPQRGQQVRCGGGVLSELGQHASLLWHGTRGWTEQSKNEGTHRAWRPTMQRKQRCRSELVVTSTITSPSHFRLLEPREL
jgi:hypothetical protein